MRALHEYNLMVRFVLTVKPVGALAFEGNFDGKEKLRKWHNTVK